jgi:hypothetical protein
MLEGERVLEDNGVCVEVRGRLNRESRIDEPFIPAGAARRAMPLEAAVGAAVAKPARARAAVTNASMIEIVKGREEVGVVEEGRGWFDEEPMSSHKSSSGLMYLLAAMGHQRLTFNPRPR